jgi:hypothetical protein
MCVCAHARQCYVFECVCVYTKCNSSVPTCVNVECVNMCVCLRMHVCVYLCICICVYVYMCVYMVVVYTYIHIHIHIHGHKHTHTYMYAYIHTCVCACVHVHKLSCMWRSECVFVWNRIVYPYTRTHKTNKTNVCMHAHKYSQKRLKEFHTHIHHTHHIHTTHNIQLPM